MSAIVFYYNLPSYYCVSLWVPRVGGIGLGVFGGLGSCHSFLLTLA